MLCRGDRNSKVKLMKDKELLIKSAQVYKFKLTLKSCDVLLVEKISKKTYEIRTRKNQLMSKTVMSTPNKFYKKKQSALLKTRKVC